MIVATIGAQRTGTKLLAQMISSGSEIVSFGEVFSPDSRQIFSFSNFLGSADAGILPGAEERLDFYVRSLLSVTKAIHLDIMFNQLEYCCTSWNPYPVPFMYSYLKTRKAFVIHLERDIRESFISSKVLEVTGVAHAYATHTGDGLHIALKEAEFRLYEEYILEHRALARRRFDGYEQYIALDYAQLAAGQRIPATLLDSLQRHADRIGVPFDATLVQRGTPTVQRAGRDITIDWS